MAYFPMFIDLQNKLCVVAGGGRVAARKVKTLLSYGARVRVIAPHIEDELLILEGEHKIELLRREACKTDFIDGELVIAATNNSIVNQEIGEYCSKRGIYVNIADNREKSSFLFPACVKRDEVSVGISTGGKSPALAKKIREEIEQMIDESYGETANYMGEIREQIIHSGIDGEQRKKVFYQLLSSIEEERAQTNITKVKNTDSYENRTKNGE